MAFLLRLFSELPISLPVPRRAPAHRPRLFPQEGPWQQDSQSGNSVVFFAQRVLQKRRAKQSATITVKIKVFSSGWIDGSGIQPEFLKVKDDFVDSCINYDTSL